MLRRLPGRQQILALSSGAACSSAKNHCELSKPDRRSHAAHSAETSWAWLLDRELKTRSPRAARVVTAE